MAERRFRGGKYKNALAGFKIYLFFIPYYNLIRSITQKSKLIIGVIQINLALTYFTTLVTFVRLPPQQRHVKLF